jgi:hypothetical protein
MLRLREDLIKQVKTTVPSRLTELDVTVIRLLEGTQREVARKFKISQSAVSMIRAGKRWSQAVPEELRKVHEIKSTFSGRITS